MCLGIPARLVEIVDAERGVAKAEIGGVRRNVSIELLADEVGAGDWVLVHVGFALAKIDEAEAAATLATLEAMGDAYRDEVETLRSDEGA
jgi:hydrogenase expression/formation protein HypC